MPRSLLASKSSKVIKEESWLEKRSRKCIFLRRVKGDCM